MVKKAKTHRGAAKRFKITGTGKFMRNRTGHSHLLGKKSSRRKRRLSRPVVVHPSEHARLRKALNV